jgi:hypothetical protein
MKFERWFPLAWLSLAILSLAPLLALPIRWAKFLALDGSVMILYAIAPAILFSTACVALAFGMRSKRPVFRSLIPVLCLLTGLYLAFHAVLNLLGFLFLLKLLPLVSGLVGVAGLCLSFFTWQAHRRLERTDVSRAV